MDDATVLAMEREHREEMALLREGHDTLRRALVGMVEALASVGSDGPRPLADALVDAHVALDLTKPDSG